MIDDFQQALAEVIPALKGMRGGLTGAPTASAEVLKKLKGLPKADPIGGGKGGVSSHTFAIPDPVSDPVSFPPSNPVSDPQKSHTFPPPGQGDGGESGWTLDTLREAALACVKCPHLAKSRTQVVFGVGNPKAKLMFVGEAPGADEDLQGEPFVGRAGQLLTKIIQAMGFSREDVYIGNVLKCRPDMPKGATGNRKPRPEEMNTCLPWLEKQIELIQPKVMVALGATALEGLLGETKPVSGMRGKWLDFRGIPVMATYHPAYLLRNQSVTEKRKVWEDMLKVLERLGQPITEKQRKFFTKSDA